MCCSRGTLSFVELCHQVGDAAPPELSTSEFPTGLRDAGREGLTVALSLPIPDDLDEILLLLLRELFNDVKCLLKRRTGCIRHGR
jgi:hypothetical protein